MNQKKAKIIAPSSNKGGVLKTSLSVNLGGVLATYSKKTLIIDIDNQGNVATSFGIDPDYIEFTTYDLLTKNSKLKNPFDCIQSITDKLDIIVANDDMAFVEMDILTKPDKYPAPDYLFLLKKAIQPFEKEYDYIILDTPPQMGLIAANIFNAVEDVIIPYQPETYAFRSLVKTINAISNFKSSNKKLNINEIVPVRVKRTLMHNALIDTAREYAKSNDIHFSAYVIKESIKYSENIARYQMPITLRDNIPKEIIQYKTIYEKIAKEMGYIG